MIYSKQVTCYDVWTQTAWEVVVKKVLLAGTALLLMFGLLRSDAAAEGMLGKRYLALNLGQLVPGDDVVNKTDNGVMLIGARGNLPLTNNLDLFAAFGYSKMQGVPELEELILTVKTRELYAGAAYHFFPEQALDPFVEATIGWVRAEISNPFSSRQEFAKTFGEDGTNDDFAFKFATGVEVPFAGQFSARPSAAYRQVGSQEDFGAALDVNGWFNKVFFVGLNISYWLDKGDLTYSEAIGFAF